MTVIWPTTNTGSWTMWHFKEPWMRNCVASK